VQESPQKQEKADQQGKHKKIHHSASIESLYTLPPC
jgi:hypothetical protein